MRMQPATPLADILEKDWQHQVIELAKTLGWNSIYHTFDSRRSTHGFPDLVLVRDRVLYLELKREKGKLTDDQKRWLRALLDAGAEAYVARPSDLRDLAMVLQAREPDYILSRAPNLAYLGGIVKLKDAAAEFASRTREAIA